MKSLIKISLVLLLLVLTVLSSSAQEKDFLIRRGDKISVKVMQHPEFTVADITVLPDGCIQFPAIGSFRVAGFTTDSLNRKLTKALNKFIVHPIISVYVNKIENQSINLFGYLNKPGKYQVFEPVDLITALSIAGGVKNLRKKNKITILRANGEVERYKLRKLLRKSDERLKEIKLIGPGDTVVVQDPCKFEWGMFTFLITVAHLLVVVL